MSTFFSWYLLITLLGWITFPLAYHLFPALRERGYTLSRAFGLLIWGYVFWLFASLDLAQNDMGGLLLGLVVLGGLSAWAFVNHKSEIQDWLGRYRRIIITTELLFLLMFGFMAFVRSANPEIVGTEKPMELMMINGILNSPNFPPRDLWLSGYSISYYFFGYVMTSMLARFTGVPATIAFNLMISLIFGLSAIGAYGILYNLLALGQKRRPELAEGSNVESPTSGQPPASVFSPLLAPLFLLILSNAEGFLEVLHARGYFWKNGANFWTWLDIMDLRDAPTQPLTWAPTRYYWWWRASRVVQDYELNGTWRETIDEFPAFSYILGDLHPHVLSMPFVLLAVAMALNIFLGGWRGNIDLYFGQLRISKTGFFVAALMLGGLAFLNTWDILIAGALIVFGYMLAQVKESGWGWERIEDVLLLGIPVMVTAYGMYLPFFISFDSQAGGLVPNFMFITRGAQLWVMWGTLFIPLFSFLLYLWRNQTAANWRAGIFSALGLVTVLLVAMFVLGLLGLKLKPDLINSIVASQGLSVSGFIAASLTRRLTFIGSLLTILALLIPVLAFLFSDHDQEIESSLQQEEAARRVSLQPSASFVLLLIALGALLIVGPDFVYLSDNFGYRINTVFKFYYQAWTVLSLASAYGMVVLLRRLRGGVHGLFSVISVLILVVGLTYPVLGFYTKTSGFNPPFEYTLDDFDRVQRENPDEAAAMLWLRSAPDGVVAEAVGGAYSAYARVSIYTGLPTLLGWGNHEGQWRDEALQGSRAQDVETLYSTPDWPIAQEIIQRYHIRYVYIGGLERSTYRVSEEKFNLFLKPVFQQGLVTIYQVP